MLGLAAGVMIAASFWSLLSPAIEMAEKLNMIPWLIVAAGFLCGGILLFIGDKVFDIISDKQKENRSIHFPTSNRRYFRNLFRI